MVATCEACHEPMDGRSCLESGAWPWGAEPDLEGPPTGPCHDCAVKPGGLHHAGCCVARCPVCGDQRLGCECSGLVN